jgi:putative serine protease PepD
VTEGVVSFKGRTVPEGNGVVLSDAVQTSAAINAGNSGGALVNISGQIIGIPTLAATDQQLGGRAAPGVGFATPSNTAKLIVGQLASQGEVINSDRAALGVTGATSVTAAGLGAGVIVRSAKLGGAADKAGIQASDLIVQINGQQIRTLSAMQAIVAGLRPGDAVVVVHRDGTQQAVQVTLTNLVG